MKALIIQPRYLPSFEFITRLKKVDVVVFLDNTIVNHRDYENRTQVRNKDDDKWLTMPITKKEKINKVRITDNFNNDHKNKLKEYYGSESELYDYLVPEYNESYLQFMHKHYDNLFKYVGKTAYLLNRTELITGDVSGKQEIKEILNTIEATEYHTGDNCLKYGLNQEFLDDIHVKLELINFDKRKQTIKEMFDIDIKYSIIDTEMTKLKQLNEDY